MIYWSLYEPYEGHVHYHALLINDDFSDKGTCCIYINDLKPATKEQRDLLFAKMKDAGYEWDVEKKELRKIDYNSKQSYEDEAYKYDVYYIHDNESYIFKTSALNENDAKNKTIQALSAFEDLQIYDISKN